jgi:hypothetical protein
LYGDFVSTVSNITLLFILIVHQQHLQLCAPFITILDRRMNVGHFA